MISVVMPAYNTEAFIAEAIESILKQTYRDFEFIIVDDGSTDRTGEIVRQYAAQDARIQVIEGPHAGASAAMNQGIAAAQREWVAVMHSDDVAMPQRLEKQLAAAQASPEVVVWGTHAYRVAGDGRRLNHFSLGPVDSDEFHALRSQAEIVQVIHPTAFMHRETLNAVGGYDVTVRVGEDVELFDRMALHGEVRTIPEALMDYRFHDSSLAATRYQEMFMFVRYLRARQQHRLDGKPGELSFEDFQTYERSLPAWKRFNIRRRTTSGMYYRRAGMHYGNKNLLAFVGYLSLAILLAPLRSVSRLWEQMIAPKLRQNASSVD